MSLMARPLFQPKIIHGIPGRLRVRVPSLQTSPDLKATLEAQMKATPAVETVRISHATDSIIINYRPQAEGMTQTQIYQLITQITQEFFALNLNHQDQREMVVSETNGTYQEPTVALAETANPVTDDTAITQPKSLIPDSEPAVIATELTELTDEVSSTATTKITPERASTPPPAKPSRRTSPRKPRARKKPEPPANS